MNFAVRTRPHKTDVGGIGNQSTTLTIIRTRPHKTDVVGLVDVDMTITAGKNPFA